MAGDYVDYENKINELESLHFTATAIYSLSNSYALVGEYIGGQIENAVSGNAADENNIRIALRVQF